MAKRGTEATSLFVPVVPLVPFLVLLACSRPPHPARQVRSRPTERHSTPAGTHATPASRIPFIRIVANPSAFHQRKVATVGYLNIEFEGTALYLNEEAFLRVQYESAIAIAVDEEEARRKLKGGDRGWVELEGTFTDLGKDQVFAGAITVDSIGAWPPVWLKFPDGDPRSRDPEHK